MTTSRKHFVRAALLAALVCAAAAAPALAASPAVFADGWSISRLFSGLNNRTRIIQFCVGTMALGLFILMKKLADTDARCVTPARRRGEGPSLDGTDVPASPLSPSRYTPTR